MNDLTLRELLEKYVLEDISREEAEQLARLLEQPDHRQVAESFIDSYFRGDDYTAAGSQALRDDIHARLRASIRQMDTARIAYIKRPWIWAAASVVLAILAGGWFFFTSGGNHAQQPSLAHAVPHDVPPGGNKAILTLADGRKLALDTAAQGVVAQQGASKIVKLRDGQLAYDPVGAPAKEMAYNTLSTPTGGQFQLTLPDGTSVWLDAASSITYPTSFAGKLREVQITGQAYLEVAKNDLQPFIVRKGRMEIKVLGTAFNVNAYDDETTINTTLVEGAVKVLDGNEEMLLRPGQQALLGKDGGLQLMENIDMPGILAWKTGMFRFRGADIYSVMRQVARWYDVSVQYEGGRIGQTIYGTMPRSLSAASMFKVLEEAGGVHFKIEGKKVVVTP